MTKRNELRRFSSKSIEDLINAGLRMVYDKNCKADGFYYPDLKMVEIKPNPKQYENLVILHEWLHAYEDLILNQQSTEGQIDWWANYHNNRDVLLVYYIRQFFDKEGF